jgi:hypothetical protein
MSMNIELPDPSNPESYSHDSLTENQDIHEKVYQYYALFGCDVERAAIAANLPVERVRQMALDGRWEDQLKVLVRLKQSGKPGDMERATNRAINLVQAHRYRLLLERLLREFSLLTPAALRDWCMEITEGDDGIVKRKLVTRPFADLATALEKCQSMTYLALCDTATDRSKRGETVDESQTAADVHVQIAGGLQRMRERAVAAKAIVDAPKVNTPSQPLSASENPSAADRPVEPVTRP